MNYVTSNEVLRAIQDAEALLPAIEGLLLRLVLFAIFACGLWEFTKKNFFRKKFLGR